MEKHYDILIIGGGAAGFFTAINTAEAASGLTIAILEKNKEVLSKVRVSGGGRCNVTHAEFLPKELTAHYPRGEKELLGPFHRFMTGDTMEWFESRGVPLKIEDDGRIFPVSDSSQSVIDCFMEEVNRHGIEVHTRQAVTNIHKEDGLWILKTKTDTFLAEKLVIATGSSQKMWKLLESLGHRIVSPVASLFTFNIDDERIRDLSGISTDTHVRILAADGKESLLESDGPLLITHWGMSGPAILKLSAWGARLLEPLDYRFRIAVNWLGNAGREEVQREFSRLRTEEGRKKVLANARFDLPNRLWRSLVNASGIASETSWGELTKAESERFCSELTAGEFYVDGKSTFKEEFVTAGGVELSEVNFKTFESKVIPNLYFAGEVLNIDAITGGFNFQNAWTGGYIVARSLTTKD